MAELELRQFEAATFGFKGVLEEIETQDHEPLPNALAFVKRLSTPYRGRLGILTPLPEREVIQFLNYHHINSLFREGKNVFPVPFEMSPEFAPQPPADTYDLIADQLRVSDNNRLLVVESEPAIIAVARQAGCAVLAIATTHSYEELEQLETGWAPFAVAENMGQTRDVLDF